MRIAYYCQHILGVGHFHRSLEICRACAVDNDVTMIVGGPPLSFSAEPFTFHQLPGLRMDEQFSGLIPCDEHTSLKQTQKTRKNSLLNFFHEFTPDVLIIELFPFGRKAFRFELIPLLEAAAQTSCRVACSLRDILVEKRLEHEKHEQNAVAALNRYFNMLLVHSDPQMITLEETFDLYGKIRIPVHYTGFITPLPSSSARTDMRQTLGLTPEERLIVASIGSGSVGSELLEAVYAAACTMVETSSCRFILFTGPYCKAAVVDALSAQAHSRITVERFTDSFVDLLAAADLSISMAGYNTSMNVLAAGVPALMMPFDQNREQRIRITKLIRSHPITLVQDDDLQTDRLISLIEKQLAEPRYRTDLLLDGAAYTVRYLQEMQ